MPKPDRKIFHTGHAAVSKSVSYSYRSVLSPETLKRLEEAGMDARSSVDERLQRTSTPDSGLDSGSELATAEHNRRRKLGHFAQVEQPLKPKPITGLDLSTAPKRQEPAS